MADLDQCILDAAKASWGESFLKGTPNTNNCSGFVKSVAAKVGVPLPATADADGIGDALSAGWTKLKSGIEAARSAGTGHLVLAVLKESRPQPATPPRPRGRDGGRCALSRRLSEAMVRQPGRAGAKPGPQKCRGSVESRGSR
jgi:hypothetical protein